MARKKRHKGRVRRQKEAKNSPIQHGQQARPEQEPETEAGQPQQRGQQARQGGHTLRSYAVGAIPIINHFLKRLRLDELLGQYIPVPDGRTKLPAARTLLVLVRNILMAREPIYGVREWAREFAPYLFDLWPDELGRLGDDRLGRDLERFFEACGPELILAVVRHAVSEFQVSLDELHNDSTSVSFFGAYPDAEKEGRRRGRPTLAITWGHSKDHRPDLKQLLYILTITDDGGVPVYFTSASGNTCDDVTHRETWDLLRQLTGRPDFLYVADCKVATTENMNHIARLGGRFVSVLPRSRKEDATFRERLHRDPKGVRWRVLYELFDKEGHLSDRLSGCTDEFVSAEGYRLLWYHSTRKAEGDAATRAHAVQRAVAALTELRERLHGPRTRFRDRQKVERAVEEILRNHEVTAWVMVHVEPRDQVEFRQTTTGSPTERTLYVRKVTNGYTLSWQIDNQRLAEDEEGDGMFPLITNDRELDAEALLRAHKRQPIIEKRFSQLKTDFAVAPVYLKSVTRIQGLMAVYFLVLLVQTLLERELRQAMAAAKIESLPLYPEGRDCKRPTAVKVLGLFDPIQRHELTLPKGEEMVMVTELSPLQRKILRLLKISSETYGLD